MRAREAFRDDAHQGRADGLPTVVLVHGAFADGSSWKGVIERLQAKGVPVTAPANPLRGIAADSAYIAAVFKQIEGPVVAVGHSYGGAVITNAATDANNVVGLVYVAAFAPDEGETFGEAEAASKDSVLNTALVPRHYPTGDGGSAPEFSIDPAKVHDAFAGDLSEREAALIRAIQRPSPSSPILTRRASLPGRAGLPGRWSQRATEPPERTSSVPWRTAPAQRSPMSTART